MFVLVSSSGTSLGVVPRSLLILEQGEDGSHDRAALVLHVHLRVLNLFLQEPVEVCAALAEEGRHLGGRLKRGPLVDRDGARGVLDRDGAAEEEEGEGAHGGAVPDKHLSRSNHLVVDEPPAREGFEVVVDARGVQLARLLLALLAKVAKEWRHFWLRRRIDAHEVRVQPSHEDSLHEVDVAAVDVCALPELLLLGLVRAVSVALGSSASSSPAAAPWRWDGGGARVALCCTRPKTWRGCSATEHARRRNSPATTPAAAPAPPSPASTAVPGRRRRAQKPALAEELLELPAQVSDALERAEREK
mmetsp:Transcript_21846/g.70564  ORF Transcript_21846/g.70564 Transcript_21846/m.70564 type:complete len:304 (+) Transcript_21846:2624-3535(+)